MKTYSVFLGLGSNVGDRHGFMTSALAALKTVAGTKVIWTSSVYETDPYGKTDQAKFLNAVVQIETTMLPPALLQEVKRIEQAVGRKSSEHWGPREIDIDILLYDGFVHSDDSVTVPHPELEKRKFVLVPMREIAPDVVHPVNGMTMTELSAACPDTGRVVKTSFRLLL